MKVERDSDERLTNLSSGSIQHLRVCCPSFLLRWLLQDYLLGPKEQTCPRPSPLEQRVLEKPHQSRT